MGGWKIGSKLGVLRGAYNKCICTLLLIARQQKKNSNSESESPCVLFALLFGFELLPLFVVVFFLWREPACEREREIWRGREKKVGNFVTK